MGPGRSNGPANRDRGYRGISNQACKFGPKLVSFRKLAGFQNLTSLGPKFKVDKFKLAGFRKVHKFGPKLVGFLNNSQLFSFKT